VQVRSSRSTAAALLMAALNLRLAIAAVPPVLGSIRADTGLSSAGGGLLTAVPVFCFGACALWAPRLIRRFGLGPLLTLVLVAVIGGCALRLLSPVAALFAGTAVIGGAIAIGNVLVPSLIKRDFAAQRVAMTALYSVALFIGGGLSAGLTVPLGHLTGLGWRETVALWAILAVLGLGVWLPHARAEARRDAPTAPLMGVGGLWRDRLAWCVTLFMGLQSLGYYATLSWIPTILEDHGVSAGTAGWLLSYSTIPGLLAALGTPLIERRLTRPGRLVILAAGLCAGGYLGLLLAPADGIYAWMTLLGLGQGVALSLALGYITARAPDGHHAARLSTMAQSVGYMLAAGGPFLLGALHGWTGGWTVPLCLLLALLVPLVGAGLVASAPRFVLGQVPPAGIEPASRA
jgi:CP family cyanate transporter-like MFS transporter